MAGGRRSRRCRRGHHRASSTGIGSLGEDILLEIFLRLPSLATLVRAALTCRAWRRAVASSPSFRRRFCALHPAPLLGLFTDPRRNALPVFTTAHHRDRDVLAAVRGGDFFLTSLQEAEDDVPLRWSIANCRHGYLIVANWDSKLLAVVNPLARQSRGYIDLPNQDIAVGHRGQLVWGDVHLISSDEDPMSFRLLRLCHDESRVTAVVFSSYTSEWRVLPWVEVAVRRSFRHHHHHDDDDDIYWLRFGIQGNGIVYWPFMNREHMLTLDTETMEFFVSKLPPCLKLCYSFTIGETKDGVRCIVYDTGRSIGYDTGSSINVLMHRVEEDGVERWALADTIRYEDTHLLDDELFLDIVGIKDGFVYLATSEMVLSLCLETMELEELFPKSFHAHYFYPYFMAWPPSLVGSIGRFALLQDDPNSV